MAYCVASVFAVLLTAVRIAAVRLTPNLDALVGQEVGKEMTEDDGNNVTNLKQDLCTWCLHVQAEGDEKGLVWTVPKGNWVKMFLFKTSHDKTCHHTSGKPYQCTIHKKYFGSCSSGQMLTEIKITNRDRGTSSKMAHPLETCLGTFCGYPRVDLQDGESFSKFPHHWDRYHSVPNIRTMHVWADTSC